MEISNPPKNNSSRSSNPNPVRPMNKKIFLFGLVACTLVGAVAIAASGKKVLSQAWGVIQQALASPDSGLRELAVQSLDQVKGPEAEEALLSALLDDSEYVRIWAAKGLAKRGNYAGREKLVGILLTSSEKTPAEASGP